MNIIPPYAVFLSFYYTQNMFLASYRSFPLFMFFHLLKLHLTEIAVLFPIVDVQYIYSNNLAHFWIYLHLKIPILHIMIYPVVSNLFDLWCDTKVKVLQMWWQYL